MTRLVLDASTATLLAKAGLLRKVVERIETGIGQIAAAEAVPKRSDDAMAIATLIEEGRLERLPAAEGAESLTQDFRLHAGEAEAINLARSNHAVCGTDDGRAIRCCRVVGISFTTAVGLLVALTEGGDLDPTLASELLVKLERFGRYHSRILEDAALRMRAVTRDGEKS